MASTTDPFKKARDLNQANTVEIEALMQLLDQQVDGALHLVMSINDHFNAAADALARVVGKAVKVALAKAAKSARKMLDMAIAAGKAARQEARDIHKALRPGADRATVLKTVKAKLAKLVSCLKNLAGYLKKLVADLEILAPAIKTLEKMKGVLQLMFSWIRKIGGASARLSGAIKAAKKAVKDVEALLPKADAVTKELAKG